jgi:hypothetical protein
MSANGRLSASELAPIGGGYYLRKDAAAAFNAMADEAQRVFGRRIAVIAGYRTYDRQVFFWNLYLSGRGNLAARPGTSNHGWGLAIDLASHTDRQLVDRIGAKYGFSKSWSDAPSEWWHIKFDPSRVTVHIHPPLKRGMKNSRVKALQKRLRTLGYRGVPTNGHFGLRTQHAVKRFQRTHGLAADGVVGPMTSAALERAKPK